VLIDGEDHQLNYKTGGGIMESLVTGLGFDYAYGDSDQALPNGSHGRSFCFVHPQDGLPGYFVLFDEVAASRGGTTANIVLHPNADHLSVVTEGQLYEARIGPKIYTEKKVLLDILFGSSPSTVEIKDGVLAEFYDNSVVGKYIYASFPLNENGVGAYTTVLFPFEEGSGAQPIMQPMSLDNASGAGVNISGAYDYAFAAAGRDLVDFSSGKFQGRAALWRVSAESSLSFYFVRKGRKFSYQNSDSGFDFGFSASKDISIFMKDGRGMAVSDGAEAAIQYPNAAGVKIDGIAAEPIAQDAASITFDLPEGTHDIELVLGESPPADDDDSSDDDASVADDDSAPQPPGDDEEQEKATSGEENGCGCSALPPAKMNSTLLGALLSLFAAASLK
jgi:hypothetical protein